uniref:GDP-Man:Man(3)GlcNAc(2)-PP-Dol alpha-1,2-mannosyltransferase n=1 Tax=Phallusia mammillata TaxID=59560 RepID=A0A6F9D624_9ASCI|nr:GDP-Man:Man(3)GlcNAc(2)-PP-Dol alpha-1,2-mannosyltransferase-like [Phallusia mammillata]
MILVALVYLLVGFLAFLLLLKLGISWRRSSLKKAYIKGSILVGFFHPYCNAGGGGERVLWCAVRSIQQRYPTAECIIYTGDTETTKEEIIKKAKKTFNISLLKNVEFVFLYKRGWVEAKRYPVFTLLGQSLGSIILGLEALFKFPPDVYLDTMGYAFTFPVFKYLGGCKIGCYVHYPTISTDMLGIVKDRTNAFNNRALIARSSILTSGKLLYYRLFAYIYGVAGRCAETIMVNSSWTNGHIQELWQKDLSTFKVFPPCDIGGFLELSIERQQHETLPRNVILSIAQFRPEKNHALQVKAFDRFLSECSNQEKQSYKLVMVGGCRNQGDKDRVEILTKLAEDLNISQFVEIKTNIDFSELKELLSVAIIGIHTMSNEHFGIGIVEFQAAGVIALANDSGGPKMDIVQENTGFLACDEESYAATIRNIFSMSEDDRSSIAVTARKSCDRFSEEHFETDFLNAIAILFESSDKHT